MIANNLKINLLSLLSAGFFMASCSQMDNLTPAILGSETETVLAADEESITEDSDAATIQTQGMSAEKMLERLPECATVTTSGDVYPQTITIDFGDGCEDRRGKVKTGKMIIELTDDMSNMGAQRTVTFEDFKIDGRQVEGSKIVTNTSMEDSENVVFSKEVNMTITDEEGNMMTRKMVGTRTFMEGFGDDDCSNDIFEMDGTATTTRPDGATMTREITSPLMIDRSCSRHPISGEVEMTCDREDGTHTSTMNFGDGSCDTMGTLTRDGVTEEVDLNEMGRRKKGKNKSNTQS